MSAREIREETIAIAVVSLLAEGVSVLLFFFAAIVWFGVLAGRI